MKIDDIHYTVNSCNVDSQAEEKLVLDTKNTPGSQFYK
jgi:hypothetical protein